MTFNKQKYNCFRTDLRLELRQFFFVDKRIKLTTLTIRLVWGKFWQSKNFFLKKFFKTKFYIIGSIRLVPKLIVDLIYCGQLLIVSSKIWYWLTGMVVVVLVLMMAAVTICWWTPMKRQPVHQDKRHTPAKWDSGQQVPRLVSIVIISVHAVSSKGQTSGESTAYFFFIVVFFKRLKKIPCKSITTLWPHYSDFVPGGENFQIAH